MKKLLPNLLTLSRFPLTLWLLATEALAKFLAVYLLCCLTDVLDGFAARQLGVCSRLGAQLDSMADLALAAVLIFKLWPVAVPGPGFTLWIAVVAALRLGAALTARLRFGVFGLLHTRGNKLTGILLALYPFLLGAAWSHWALAAVLIAATLSALEELAIQWTADTWEPDRPALFGGPMHISQKTSRK